MRKSQVRGGMYAFLWSAAPRILALIIESRELMENHRVTPLQVGDRVTLHDLMSGQTGVVLDCLSHGYYLVRWSDHRLPMTHHRYSLRRISAEGQPFTPATRGGAK